MPTAYLRRAAGAIAVVSVIAAAMPWVAGQLIAWKVERQLVLLNQHPALSVLETEWHSGYSQSHGHATVVERVGCGLRPCSETRVEFAASHLSWAPLGWGNVVASADLNRLLNHTLLPAVAPLNIVAQVGLLGRSVLTVSMAPSWHRIQAERADALAFSGINESFSASNYAQNWDGTIEASFTLITESASADQRNRMGGVMQSLGIDPSARTEQMGAVIVRVIALMKELEAAVMVWQGKELAWQPTINAAPTAALNPSDFLTKFSQPSNTVKPLNLALTPDVLVASSPRKPHSVALSLPSFEAWHGDVPMPAVVRKLDNATIETEPELDLWQINLQWRDNKVTLNGLAIWKDR